MKTPNEAKKLILNYIKSHKYKVSDKLPSEKLLSADLGIGRLMLREAVAALKNEGILTSVQGSGTYIAHSPDQIEDILNNNLSVTEMIEAGGYKPGVCYFKKELVEASEEVASKLQVSSGISLLSCMRVRTADNEPVVYSQDYLSPRLTEKFLSVVDENVSLYLFVENEAGIKIGLSVAEMTPVKADKETSSMLKIKSDELLIKFNITVNDSFGAPLIYAVEYLRCDWFKFIIHRWR